MPRGRKPKEASGDVAGEPVTDSADQQAARDEVFPGELKSNVVASQEIKKNAPRVTYQVFHVSRDGKEIVKIRQVAKYPDPRDLTRPGVTEQKLAIQITNGKRVAGFMSVEQARKLPCYKEHGLKF